jgi:type VI secretion system protein VasD
MSRTSWPRFFRRPSSAAVARAVSSVLLVGAALGPLATGCAEPPKAPKDPCDRQFVTLQIYGSGTVNPNENGNPRPVSVRIYQLGSDLKLQNARYDDILLKDKETLGEDIVKSDDVTVYPNDLVEIQFERDKAAEFLGGVAYFHEPRGQAWKTFYEFPPIPGDKTCGPKGAAAPENDVKVQFFVDEAKIDNGSQYDPDMFPKSQSVRKLSLPKKSAPGTGGGGAPAPAAPAAQK